jgi:hypothetical protein
MTNPTSNFGWQMPTSTDLVTDLPADFEVFGQAVDTSMADLKGGTTGQILSKATNTDMDFVWIANDQGDITGITASTPLTGGGTSGAITIGIQDGTTAQKGAVQLENSTSSTSTTTAAVPASVKSAYDLANTANTTAGSASTAASNAQTTANAAIPKSTVTTAGDIIYATGSAAVTRLGVGSAGQVLAVNSGASAVEWITPSAGGGLTLIATTNMSGSSVTVSSIPSTYKHLMIVFKKVYYNSNDYPIQFRFNSDSSNSYYWQGLRSYNASVDPTGSNGTQFEPNIKTRNAADNYLNMFGSFNLYNYTTTTPKGYDSRFYWADSGGTKGQTIADGTYYNTSAISSITVIAAGQSFSGGTMYTYGVS